MTLPEWVKAGVSFHLVYGNAFDTLWHVRGIVDDQAVCRRWSRNKRRWMYDMKDQFFFQVNADRFKVKT